MKQFATALWLLLGGFLLSSTNKSCQLDLSLADMADGSNMHARAINNKSFFFAALFYSRSDFVILILNTTSCATCNTVKRLSRITV